MLVQLSLAPMPPALTLITCSNRVPCLNSYLPSNVQALAASDEAITVIDTTVLSEDEEHLRRLSNANHRVFFNQCTRGLVYSRNTAMMAARFPFVVFVDDDVSISADAIEAIRSAFSQGAHVVGVRLQLAQHCSALPFYISAGQLHYLGVHNPLVPSIKPWGACLGINSAFARGHSLWFCPALGRYGAQLMSGDDTSFVQAMVSRGAKQVALNSVVAFHNIQPDRMCLRYILRRAFWQGRSELRRSQFLSALAKEYNRNMRSDSLLVLRLLLTVLLLFCYVSGGSWEFVKTFFDAPRFSKGALG